MTSLLNNCWNELDRRKRAFKTNAGKARNRVQRKKFPQKIKCAMLLTGERNMGLTKEDVLEKLAALKTELRMRYKVKEMGLFGSFVREAQIDSSDIDILVDFDETADLFDLVGLGQFLEETLQRKVDVVPKKALRKEIRESVLKEVAAL